MRYLQIAASVVLVCATCLSAHASTATVTITGSEQQTSAGLSDSGTFSLSVSSYTETISYGRFSTNASVASAIAAKFSQDCNSPVVAHASGATIVFETRNPSTPLGNIAANSVWDQNDFQLPSFALNVTTGQPPSFEPTFTCSPNTISSGQNLACTLTLAVRASSPVSLTIAGSAWTAATPNPATGVATANGVVTESSSGSYVVAYAYPGDAGANIPPASGSTNIIVMVSGSGSGISGNTLYQFQIVQPSGTSGYDGVGNVVSYNDSVNGAWALGYDSLNRLVSSVQAPVNAGAQFGCWAYDSFGNMLTQAMSSQAVTATANSCQPQSGANNLQSSYQYNASNQISQGSWLDSNNNTHTGTPQYDNAGNMTSDLINNYLYDADGHVCAVNNGGSITGYLYNAEGQRVAKGILQSMTCDPTQLQVTSVYFIGPDGEAMTEMDGQSNWVRTEVSAADQFLATYTPTGIHYPVTDWLGTKRMVFNPSFTTTNGLEETCTSLPFGDRENCSAIDSSPKHYTGKERDTESGLDYFGARYYGSSMGRFMSPDDGSGVYSDPANPQSWNLYGYVQNNPLTNIDPDGHDCIYADGNGGGYVQRGDCTSDTDNGVFVNGTIDVNSFKYNANNNSSSFTYTPDDGASIGTGVLQGPNLTNGFEPGSLGAAVFGPQNNALWNNAAGTVNAAGNAEMSMLIPLMPELLIGAAPEVTLGLGGVGAARGAHSQYEDVTKGNSIPNRQTNVTVKQFGDSLEANGFTKSVKGDVTVYTKGDTQYTVYSQARSTGGPTAQVKVGGEVVGKIRLQP